MTGSFWKILIFAVTLLAGFGSTSQAQTTPVNGQALAGLEAFDTAALNLLDKYSGAGASLVIMRGGRIVLARGYGWADKEAQVAMQPDALFRTYYLNNVITAAAVLRLIEQGNLTLQTRAFGLLNDLPPLDGATVDPRLANITIRHLLEGTSGLPGVDTLGDFWVLLREYAAEAGVPAPLSCEDAIRVAQGKPLISSPGAREDGSILDYCVLAKIIERVSGMSYEAYVRANVFAPLGITEPVMSRTFRKDQPPREVVYYTESPELGPSAFDDVPGPLPYPYGVIPLESQSFAWSISTVDYNRITASLTGYGPAILSAPPGGYVGYVPPFEPGFLWDRWANFYGAAVVTGTTDLGSATLFVNFSEENAPYTLIDDMYDVINISFDIDPWPAGNLNTQFFTPPALPNAAIEINTETQSIESFGTLTIPGAGPVTVELDGRSSMPGAGNLTGYQWRNNGEVISTTSRLNYEFTAPVNNITLRVTNSAGRQHAVSATVRLAGNVPVITSVNAAGGGTPIAANTWIEIKGVNLSPATVPGGGVTWSDAPEFAQGMMPTQLAEVTVTVNGNAGYTYFVSGGQINILTSLAMGSGPVEVIVTTPEGSSEPFLVDFADLAPALFQIGEGNAAAKHLDGSLIGPPDLFPGFTTGAANGETIVVYANGFGAPSTMLTEGSAAQFGALPELPVIKFNGVPGNVIFAGVVGPGLFQFNVEVPPGVTGDVSITVEYKGVVTPADVTIHIVG